MAPVEPSLFTPHAAGPALPPGRTIPLSPERYALQFTVSLETHERLLRVQDLLASAVTSADIPDVFDRALKLLEEALERRRFAATESPRTCRGPSDARRVSAEVRRKVWERDGGRCTFVSDDGHRCEARRWLEFDHRTPAARGGASTVENLRLRCRTHNQLEAERVFGAGFMAGKRESAGQRHPEAVP
jgi:5-methylcytosine-specific restriction endonuclease McrA